MEVSEEFESNFDHTNYIEKIILEYQGLPKYLKKQISKVSKILITNEYFRRKVSQYIRRIGVKNANKELKKVFTYMFILERITPMDILTNQMLMKLTYCYDSKDNIIRIEKLIKVGKHACVVLGMIERKKSETERLLDEIIKENNIYENEVVIKWYKSERNNIEFESGIYKKLNEIGCPLPFFSTKFMYWNEPVLVIEKLDPIDFNDNEYEIGCHIIYQLFFLHKIGVHCDIKPQNIMKKVHKGKQQYFLIDFGGVATETIDNGYRRWLWSPKWTCQKPHQRDQVVYPIHDFIELGFTINYLRTKGSADFKKNFKGKVLRYMRYLRKMKEFPETQDYMNLIEILQGSRV